MSYNTLDHAYTYGNCFGHGGDGLSERIDRILWLKELFRDGGWQITDVPFRVRIRTTLPILVPSHSFCDLADLGSVPTDEDTLFAISFSDTGYTGFFVVDNNIGCFSGTSGFVNVVVCEAHIILNTIYDPGVSGGGWVAYVSPAPYPNTAVTHDTVWQAAAIEWHKREVDMCYLNTRETAPNDFTSEFYLETDDPKLLTYTIQFGGFLSSSADELKGYGFVATSQTNKASNNFSQIYVYTNVSTTKIFIRGVFGDDIDLSITPGFHPLTVIEEDTTSSFTDESDFLASRPIHGFVGPYYFNLQDDTPALIYGGALTPHRLEANSGGLEVNRIRILAASFPGSGWNWAEVINGFNHLYHRGGAVFGKNQYKLFNHINLQDSTNVNILKWAGDIVPVTEAWVGFNISDSSDPISVFCTIPNAIYPLRNIDTPPLSTILSRRDDIPFVFDDHLFRYWEHTFGPIAFWVIDPRTFVELPFEKSRRVPLYVLDTASLSPTSFSSGGTCTLTLTILLEEQVYTDLGGAVYVYCENARISVNGTVLTEGYFAFFPPEQTTTTIELTDNGLDVTERVVIKIFHNAGESIYQMTAIAN